MISKYIPDFVINTDQTGCNDQTTHNRSLDFQGVKTVLVKKKDLNKLTHFYTAQYSITASGKLLPKVFLSMQESTNKFGPLISKKVEAIENEFKNVFTCSKSGKITRELYKQFLEEIIQDYVKSTPFFIHY